MSHLGGIFVSLPVVVKVLPPGMKSGLKPIKNLVRWIMHSLSTVKIAVRLVRVFPTALTAPDLTFNYIYDLDRFLKWSSINARLRTQTQLLAVITMDYHRIEKGLALREPRLRFGPKVIERLLTNLREYQSRYGLDATGQVALNALSTYCQFNRDQGIEDQQLNQAIRTLKEQAMQPENCSLQGGTIEITKQDIDEATQHDFQPFFERRYSIRQFAPDDVDMCLIEKAVVMAQKTPSVCNRQSAKVYVFSQQEDKQKVLSYQNGNRGFGDQASKVLIVTSDLQHFMSVGERNQCWIDGGMFSMSLVYALHSLGLGTCCLNWSVESQVDQALREAVGIPESEAVMMMLAVGHLPDKLKVAQSPRKNIKDVMVVK
jgi:nitroreductase